MSEEKGLKGFQKGSSGGPGRPKGMQNKMTSQVKEAVEYVYNNIEYEVRKGSDKQKFKGREAFLAWAQKNPETFFTKFLSKFIPKPIEVSGIDGEDIKTSMQIVILPDKLDKITDN